MHSNVLRAVAPAFLVCCAIAATAQPEITSRVQPEAGDTFMYAVDTALTSIDYGTPGLDKTWDFRTLGSAVTRSEVYRPATSGSQYAAFPDADAVLQSGFNEQYFAFYPDRTELLGIATRGGGPIPGLGGANVFPAPVVIQRYPTRFLDDLSYSTAVRFALSASVLPDSLLNSLPIQPDSFQTVTTTTVDKLADAWGIMHLPARSWSVLREKRVTTVSNRVEAKVPFLGWIDVTSFAAALFGNLFADVRTTAYAFLSDETKGLIAQVNLDTLGNVLSVTFKPDDRVKVDAQTSDANERLFVFPQPASEFVVVRHPRGLCSRCAFRVLSPDGREMLRGETASDEWVLDPGNLAPGRYELQVADLSGRRIATTPLLVAGRSLR
ncbi:MAG: hypothetical protein KBF37_05950 [Saprospiraceae bacterium]|nr:hypothetical protein [Saprospiraceae bacterium]